MASSQRQQVHRTKANFRASDAVPGLAQYIVYQPPYFKLRVGNFRDRLEAHRHLQKIKAVPSFNDAFIVQDRIQIEHDQ